MNIPDNLRWLATHPVTKQHPLRTWFRWVYWQIRQRITSRPKVIHFTNDTRLAIYPHEGLTGFWYVECPEYDEMQFLRKFLRPGDVFYDVGANAGGLSIFAGGLGGEVFAFEPVPSTFSRLQENVWLNASMCSVTALNHAVGSTIGHVRITTEFGTGNHLLSSDEPVASIEVEVFTLDEVTKYHPAPNFLKVDVEGHELDVIKGAKSLLESPRLIGLMLETFRPHNWKLENLRKLEKLLLYHGFAPYSYDARTNKIIELRLPHEGDNNTFYFRDPERVQSRLNGTPD